MINETILAIIIAFAVSAILCPIVIPFLHKLKFGQQVREDGPQAHLKKQGTPTMGGLVFLTAVVITSLLYIRDYPRIIPVPVSYTHLHADAGSSLRALYLRGLSACAVLHDCKDS